MNTVTYPEQSVWQLQKAKAQFSEVVNRALAGIPQLVTRSGRPSVYIVAADTYNTEQEQKGLSKKDILLASPYSDITLDISRDKSEGRELEL